MKEPSNKIVSVVVVTCGINDYLRACLESVKEQSYSPLEIIVIDNSLNQSFNQDIARSYPAVQLYSSPTNLFYCASLNKGIDLSQGSFVLCLNDDVILDKRFIEEALRGFFIDSRVGMVSGKILRSDRKTIDTAGLFLSLCRSAKERGYGLKDRGQFERAGFIFGVNGAVAFYRKEMLDELNLNSEYFDSDFHFFYEDLDIAWRARRFGWKGYYIPQARAFHVRGGSVRKVCGRGKPYARRYLSDELHVDLIKNRYLAIIKNESWPDFLLRVPFIALYDFIVWIYLLFFKPKLAKTLLANLKYVRSAFKKRKFLADRLNFARNK
jgi:GT2 family glycosyltransferase